MQKIPFTAPEHKSKAFNCPHCLAYSQQIWVDTYSDGRLTSVVGLQVSYCDHCRKFSVWLDGKMISPQVVMVEPPNADLDEDVQEDYKEAADVLQRSPRSSAALLRLALQKMCDGQLSVKGNDLNAQIKDLVSRGLPAKVQESLDALRVIGNEAVHPGVLDLKDDVETAIGLFKLVNFIAEKMISEQKEIDEIYNKIPDGKKEGIKQRDGAKA